VACVEATCDTWTTLPLALSSPNVLPFHAVHLSAIPWDFALILLALGVIVPWRGAVRVRRLLAQPELSSTERISLYASTIAFQWLAVFIVAWRALARGMRFDELGVASPNDFLTFSVAAGMTLLLCANQWFGLRRLARIPREKRGFIHRFAEKLMPRSPLESLIFFALSCTAGLSEEFLYRGFVFSIFARVFSGSAVRVALAALFGSALLFGIAHLYQGRRGMLTTFFVGVIFAGARLWTSSLVPAVIAHTCVDLIAGLAAARLLRGSPPPAPDAPASPHAPSAADDDSLSASSGSPPSPKASAAVHDDRLPAAGGSQPSPKASVAAPDERLPAPSGGPPSSKRGEPPKPAEPSPSKAGERPPNN